MCVLSFDYKYGVRYLKHFTNNTNQTTLIVDCRKAKDMNSESQWKRYVTFLRRDCILYKRYIYIYIYNYLVTYSLQWEGALAQLSINSLPHQCKLRSRNNRSSKREPWQDLRRQHQTSYQIEFQGQILGVSVDCFGCVARCC